MLNHFFFKTTHLFRVYYRYIFTFLFCVMIIFRYDNSFGDDHGCQHGALLTFEATAIMAKEVYPGQLQTHEGKMLTLNANIYEVTIVVPANYEKNIRAFASRYMGCDASIKIGNKIFDTPVKLISEIFPAAAVGEPNRFIDFSVDKEKWNFDNLQSSIAKSRSVIIQIN